MNFEPQKFFIGMIDFFSILLPGALLTYLLKDDMAPRFLGDGYYKLERAEWWTVFLFSSYLLGHFLFLIGSLLDDYVYDPIRNRTDKEQVTRLLRGRKLSPKPLRWIARLCFKKLPDVALDRVISIKESYLRRIAAPTAVNAFQWCKARLATERPEALLTVNRFEADSKFFRSFIPILVGLLGMTLYDNQWGLAVCCVVFLGLAFWRYMEQRFKSTQQAYWFILTLEAGKQTPSSSAEPSYSLSSEAEPIGPTHAGGVVFRNPSSQTEYLIVQAKENPDLWVLPKGHIEPGEKMQEAAVREVHEETGVWARINKRKLKVKEDEIVEEIKFKVVEYTLANKRVKVQFYLMKSEEEGKPEDRWRKHEWLPLDEARARLSHKESRYLLRLAEKMRTTT